MPGVSAFTAWCSELPNDNPALHEGAVWVPMTPTGWPRAIARPPRPAEPTPVSVPEPVPDAFAQLISLLCRVALGAGATRAAALLPSFVEGQVVEVGEALGQALIASGHAAPSAAGVVMSEPGLETARAWRAVLNGVSEDLSGCEQTLDSGCAELLAALSGTPGRANELRRELRRFGVAAFGLLANAA